MVKICIYGILSHHFCGKIKVCTNIGMHIIIRSMWSLPDFGNCHERGYMHVLGPSLLHVKVWLVRLLYVGVKYSVLLSSCAQKLPELNDNLPPEGVV